MEDFLTHFEKASRKYISRTPKKSGKGYDYKYTDDVNKKKISLEVTGTSFSVSGIGKDMNGNTVLKLKNKNTGKGFSIQTNGNLPSVHSAKSSIKSDGLSEKMISEIKNYISKYGTKQQKIGLNN